MNSDYPVLEFLDARTSEPVSLVVWHLRSFAEVKVGPQVVTRIEYVNGDTFDTSERIESVLLRFQECAGIAPAK